MIPLATLTYSYRFTAVYATKSVSFVIRAESVESALTKARAVAPKALAVVPVRA